MRRFVVLGSLLVLVTSSGFAAIQARSGPSFAPARSYPTGHGPAAVAIADLNGDGKPDLASANDSAHTVSVLLNRGDGSFRARRDYRTGLSPTSVAIADLNGDGRPDLAVVNNRPSTVSVLFSNGDGSFQAKLDYATGRSPSSVATGDLNADGKQDLATANGDNTVSVLLNRGDGAFQAKRDYETGHRANAVAIGDLNGDGKPDLATSNSSASVSVLLNRGDGSFQAKRDYKTGFESFSVAIGDLNGDGTPDLASTNRAPDCVPVDYTSCPGSNTVSVLLNRGDGSFPARRDYRTGLSPTSVAIGDLNDDGKPDLATANSEFLVNTVSVLANRGDGSFQARLDYRTGRGPSSVALGDLNGDGKPDLATANSNVGVNTVSVLLNRPGLCTVQGLGEQTVPAAKRITVRANCRVGNIRRAYSKEIKRGRVISQKPKPGTVLPSGGKVNLVVSRGRKR